MKVSRQGNRIQVVLNEGKQERWFNLEQHEAVELAVKLGAAVAEPKKAKIKEGDRVRVSKLGVPSRGDSYIGEILTIEEVLPDSKAVYVCDNDWVWPVDWLELIKEDDE